MADPLNILHTIGMDALYPVVRSDLKLSVPLDLKRLRQAVLDMGTIIPEIFSYYRVRDNTFHELPHDPDTVVFANQQYDEGQAGQLDFLTSPQLKIFVNDSRLIIFVSHILTDGAGTKQLLYLLADCYSQRHASDSLVNHTDIEQIKSLLQKTQRPVSEQTDHPSEALSLPQLMHSKDSHYMVIKQQLTKNQSSRLHQETRNMGVTLNDALMAAFGKTIQQYCGVSTIALACPTDMRKFLSEDEQKQLRVQNMTSRYNFNVECNPQAPLDTVIKKVHAQMMERKRTKQCFDSIRSLVKQVDEGKPIDILQQDVQANYHIREIAYTNFGVIDDQRLKFDGNTPEECVMTGSFRRMPMYQVAVSTYKGQLNLAANMIASQSEYQFGKAILDHLRLMLLALAVNA